jgi:MYND finger
MADAHDNVDEDENDAVVDEDQDYYYDDYDEGDYSDDDNDDDDDDESSSKDEEDLRVNMTMPRNTAVVAAGSSGELPDLVKEELDRRKRGQVQGPPNPLVVHALRHYFESGQADPMISGGFMTLMREIGAVAQSKDHLVKHAEHNIWYLGTKGEEDTNEWWQDQLERHEAEVRLIRYGEFIEMQEIKGLAYDPKWRFDPLDNKENLIGDDCLSLSDIHALKQQQEEDQKSQAYSNSNGSSSIDDSVITDKQLEAIAKHFFQALVQYIDPDVHQQEKEGEFLSSHYALTAATGTININGLHQDPQSQLKQESIVSKSTITLNSIRTKCRQLYKRYRDCQRPLGANLVASDQEPPAAKKLSGKKNRRRQRQHKANISNLTGGGIKKKEHADCIKDHIHALITMWDRHLLKGPPSAACAWIISIMIEMLTAAVRADPDVVRSLATATITSSSSNSNSQESEKLALVELRERTLAFALEADNSEDRPVWAANCWWRLYANLTMFLADVIVTLTGDKENRNEYRTTTATPLTPDEKLASKLFETSVSPSLLKSIESKYATERCAALKALGRIVCGISVELAMGLVKPKSTWNLLEKACQLQQFNKLNNNDMNSNEDDTSKPVATTKATRRSDRREEIMAPRSSAQGTALMIRLCGTGMIKEDSDGPHGMTIIPGPLARKMIQRGIVPFLMNLSRCDNALISAEAVGGLAQVSCVKDCRASLLEQPEVTPWLESIMSSSEGNKVSQGILLARHLLWDDNWFDPLLSIQPPIEQTIVKWAAFCMKCIRVRADETRTASKKLADEFMAHSISKIKLSENDEVPLTDTDLEKDIQEMESRFSATLAWNKMETNEGRTHLTNLALSRSVIFVSTLIRDKPTAERVLKANCLALGAACLDVPVDDTNSAAANIVGNYLVAAGSVPPNAFPDPDHVVRAAISRLSRLVNRQDITPRSFIFVRLLNGLRKSAEWAPFFQSCSDKDMEHKYVIEVFLPKIGDNIPSSSLYTITPRRGSDGDNHNSSLKGNAPKNNDRHARSKPKTRSTKLNKCDHCGKTESQPGEFKKCSQCNVTFYCGRTCQTDAWKKHKKACPILAAPKKVGKRALKSKT